MAKRKNTGRKSSSSGPKNWRSKSPKVIGIDFGIKPTVMALGDVEFPALLHKSFVALAYGEIEERTEGGIIVLRPSLAMGFEDAETAKNCFKRFKAWIDGSQDEAALTISFVDLKEGGYALCIYQEPKALLERCIPASQHPFIDPLMTFVGYVKKFPERSEGFKWFKSRAATTMVVVEPISRTESIADLSFHKSTINFYTEASIPEESMEASLLHGKDIEEGERRERRLPNPEQVFKHRWRFQSRFFPVTTERIVLNKGLASVRSALLESGYREWQIQQAMCIIALRHRTPGLFTQPPSGEAAGAAGTQEAILAYLMSNPEDALTTTVSDAELTVESIKEQVEANSEALLRYFTRAAAVPIRQGFQEELEQHGLLDPISSP